MYPVLRRGGECRQNKVYFIHTWLHNHGVPCFFLEPRYMRHGGDADVGDPTVKLIVYLVKHRTINK